MRQPPQNRPDRGAMSTESLETMSPAELADALESALDSMTEESYDPELIDAYLDALDQKAPMPAAPREERALAAFWDRLHAVSSEPQASEGESAPAHRARRRVLKRTAVTVAATVALLLAMMIGAQAAGMDVFGRLAQWTEEQFFFLIPSSGEKAWNAEYQALFRQALEEQGMPPELAPGWYPEEFTAKEPEVLDNDVATTVDLTLVDPEGNSFAVSVDCYEDAESLGMLPLEKDGSGVEAYTRNDRTFYIMSNINTNAAAWADGDLLEIIAGELSVDEIKQMIDSIGG